MHVRRFRTVTLFAVCALLTWLVHAEYNYWDHQRQCVMRCEQLTQEKMAIRDIHYSENSNMCRCDSGIAVLLN
ncbi:hypothetical protein AAEU32_13930 [Pseudoalteromonas sp. SSDWG2]|uniref:hypothetical protein n=1 Tax=Pseudoalteromonas sp. SSDWG2 TaxID=3139391 RepID=UPI003BAB4A53